MLIAEARQKIQTTQLINRLQNHGLGKLEMSSTQVRAVEILLKKAVPDLATMVLQGDDDGGAVRMTFEEEREAARQEIAEAFTERPLSERGEADGEVV